MKNVSGARSHEGRGPSNLLLSTLSILLTAAVISIFSIALSEDVVDRMGGLHLLGARLDELEMINSKSPKVFVGALTAFPAAVVLSLLTHRLSYRDWVQRIKSKAVGGCIKPVVLSSVLISVIIYYLFWASLLNPDGTGLNKTAITFHPDLMPLFASLCFHALYYAFATIFFMVRKSEKNG